MSWVKNREEFKQAVLATAKAISGQSDLKIQQKYLNQIIEKRIEFPFSKSE